jgi:hypothetical protein
MFRWQVSIANCDLVVFDLSRELLQIGPLILITASSSSTRLNPVPFDETKMCSKFNSLKMDLTVESHFAPRFIVPQEVAEHQDKYFVVDGEPKFLDGLAEIGRAFFNQGL